MLLAPPLLILKPKTTVPYQELPHPKPPWPFNSWSLTCFFPPFFSTEAPGKPVGPITFSQILADSVTLTWSPPKKDGGSPVASYTIELTEDGGRNWKAVDSVEAPSTTYTAKGLTEGQEYKFRVSAVNKVGPGEPLVSDGVTPQRKIGTCSWGLCLMCIFHSEKCCYEKNWLLSF